MEALCSERPLEGGSGTRNAFDGAGGRAGGRIGAGKPRPRKLRNRFARTFYSWHWMSAAISMVAMLFFAVTGITLNHAATIPATPTVVTHEAVLPPAVRAAVADDGLAEADVAASISGAMREMFRMDVSGRLAEWEWSPEEIYIALPRAGGDAWVSIDRATGVATAEEVDRGWIAYVNDLHKGRNTGAVWSLFIDIFAVACVIFTLTGLFLLYVHAAKRPRTWPLVLGGAALPLLVLLFFLH